MVECGVSDNYLSKAKSVNSSCWHFINDPCDSRKVLIGYEELKDKYKLLVTRRFGNPYEYIALEPLRSLIKRDLKALDYFENYRLPDGRHLPMKPVNYVQLYTRHAELFNMISYVIDNKKVLKKDLCLSMDTFWATIPTIIRTDQYDYLPQTTDNIKKRWRIYATGGYETLISAKFGNQNTAKLKTQEHIDLLLRLIKTHQNLEDTIVCRYFNMAAGELGWNFEISPQTVGLYRKQNDIIVASERKGKAQFMHRLRVAVQRSKPKNAGVLFEYDGWAVELLFQHTDKSGKTSYNNRLELMTVYDPFNDYIVGYSIGQENTATIKAAIKNSVDNIHRLTGRYFLLNELLTDNWGRGTLTEFYNRVAVIHRYASVGNAKDKTIEPFFNRLNDEEFRAQPNTTGHNLTSRKENQPNMDWLSKHKKDLPTLDQGYFQIQQLVERHRAKREQEWLNSFHELIASGRLHEIDRVTYLRIFGLTSEETNTLVNTGIRKQINGIVYHFNTLDLTFRSLTHTRWSIVYDPADLTTVLAINEDGTHQFLLEQNLRPSQAISERTESENHYANRISGFNKHMEKHIIDSISGIDERTQALIEQTSLKTMLIVDGQQKKTLQQAKNVKSLPIQDAEFTEDKPGVDAQNWWEDVDYLRNKAQTDL